MSDQMQAKPGQIVWVDLTIPNADEVRDFYRQVVGWEPETVDMGRYHDFNMKLPGSDLPAAGICFARGVNADLPPQWLIYIAVTDLDARIQKITEQGGKLLVPPQGGIGYRYCVIEDPAGAVAALLEVEAE